MMKSLIALATGLALLAVPAAAAPVSNVGGAKVVAESGALPVTTVQSRGKRVAPVGGPYRGGRHGGWHGGGRHHHGGRYYNNRWYGGGGGWGRGWGYGGGYWPGYYGYYGYGGGYYGGPYYRGPVVVAGPVVGTRVVKVRKPWTKAWVRSCSKRYRTFNPRTGYFRANSGRLVFCR